MVNSVSFTGGNKVHTTKQGNEYKKSQTYKRLSAGAMAVYGATSFNKIMTQMAESNVGKGGKIGAAIAGIALFSAAAGFVGSLVDKCVNVARRSKADKVAATAE